MHKAEMAKQFLNKELTALVDLEISIQELELKLKLPQYSHIKKQIQADVNAFNEQRLNQIIKVEACKQKLTDYLMEGAEKAE